MKTYLTSVVIVAVAGLLAACENPAPRHLSPGFGDAVRTNMAVHIVNPPQERVAGEPTDLNGARAAKVIERYQKAETVKLERPKATITFGGGE